jgi:hypothetical protein
MGNTYSDITVYGQISQNTSNNNTNSLSNATATQNVSDSNTKNAIPYVLNVTNSSDAKSQVVDQVIQAIGGGQSTSLQEVIDAASNGNSSSSSLEQVIDAASSELNNQSSNISISNTSNNTS